MSEIPITSTIRLLRCWVCGSRDGLHDHHVVPQSCGGTNGPTVTLCAVHHNVIHSEAYLKPDDRRFRGAPAAVIKLAYLTQVIYNSYLAIQGQSKPVLKSFRLSVAHQKMWNAWRATHPTLKSDQAALEAAIEILYRQHVTPLNRS